MEIPREHQHLISEEAPPAWAVRYETKAPTTTQRDGAVHPLLLRDVQINLETATSYRRIVYHLPNLVSVQHGSRIEIEFSPEVERLVIHEFCIRRGDASIDLRPLMSLRVLNRETRMERFVFNGRLLAVFVPNDVQAGDTIDYSYSLQATKQPLFGRTSGRFVLQADFSADANRCRLLYGPQRTIYAVPHNFQLQPKTAYTADGLVDCRWELDGVKPLQVETATPTWALPYRWIDYGEFATWEEVADAASLLYVQLQDPLPPQTADWLRQVQAGATSPENFIIQVQRYVADNIRYVAIGIDEHTCKPYDIATILERRYGDCKDKAILFCRLLREAGYDAVPALVHADLKEHAIGPLPRPGAFNHCIARLRLEGKTHWFDLTIDHQGGGLGAVWHPPYGMALVLNSPGEALERMAPASQPRAISSEEFVKVRLPEGVAELRVTRIFTGAAADDMRRRLAEDGLVETDRFIVKSYERLYRGVAIQSPTTVEDHRGPNRLTMVYNLVLNDIWVCGNARPPISRAYFPVRGIQRVLTLAKGEKSELPLSIQHPIHLRASLEIRLPAAFVPHRKQGVITSPAFTCKFFQETSSNSHKVNLEYTSTKDHVLAKDIAAHAKALGQLSQLATQSVSVPERAISRVNSPFARVERERHDRGHRAF
jgi:hypothetical protein